MNIINSGNIVFNINEDLNLNLPQSKKNKANCAVISSGCKLNQFETSQFEWLLKKYGLNIIDPYSKSYVPIHLFLVNSCSVTEKADIETKRIVRKIKKRFPKSQIILTGCFAQLNKNIYLDDPKIKLLDNEKKLKMLNEASYRNKNSIINQKRVRANLKIQEGCEIECAFCIIPKARPVKWSLDFHAVLSSIKKLSGAGYKEIILSGINIGSYGSYGKNFKDILCEIEALPFPVKIRISSLDPIYIDDELIGIFGKSKKLQNHFHIPLQSANDKILKAMKRHYTFNDYSELIKKINNTVKDAAIGTDIISGFPGETDDDFLETAANLKKLNIYYIHAFSYSDRTGTEAFNLKPKIRPETIKKRTGIIRNISFQKKIDFHLRFKNRVLEFLSLTGNKALSSNYIRADVDIKTPPYYLEPNILFKGLILDTPELTKKDSVICKIV